MVSHIYFPVQDLHFVLSLASRSSDSKGRFNGHPLGILFVKTFLYE